MAHIVLISGSNRFGTFGTTHTWLPTFLKEIEVTKSTGLIKRNRPDLWREISQDDDEGDIVRIGGRVLRIYRMNGIVVDE
jgi:hypothetical protein